MISAEGKTKEQLTKAVWNGIQKYMEVSKRVEQELEKTKAETIIKNKE